MSDSDKKADDKQQPKLSEINSEWGQEAEDHFGYASDEERLAKRGLEDWELVTKMPESQRGVPKWFIAVILVVLLVAIGLSFPFWGDRPGYERAWLDWGFAGAIVYIAAMSVFVYFMVNLYGSRAGGRFDSDQDDTENAGAKEKSDKNADTNS